MKRKLNQKELEKVTGGVDESNPTQEPKEEQTPDENDNKEFRDIIPVMRLTKSRK